MAVVKPLKHDGFGGSAEVEDDDAVLIASETFVKDSIVASLTGPTVVYSPAPGNRLRVMFFGYSAGADVTGVLVEMQLVTPAGVREDRQYLKVPGQPFARNMQAGKRYWEGDVDEDLVVILSAAQTVYVNFELEEI